MGVLINKYCNYFFKLSVNDILDLIYEVRYLLGSTFF